MKFYKVCGKKIVADWELKEHVCHILGIDIEQLIKLGAIEPDEPTVEDCVRFGSPGLAFCLYQALHNCDEQTAYNAVNDIKKKLKE